MYCQNCGKELPEGTTVCFECGAAQTTVSAQNMNPRNNSTNENNTSKSKVGAAVLALFLGGFGVHDFYLGFISKGVIKILLTIVSFGIIGGIWGFVDFIRIICGNINTDAKGNPII